MNKSFLTTAALVIAGTVAANASWVDNTYTQNTEDTIYSYENEYSAQFAPTNNGSVTWRSTGFSNQINAHCDGFSVDFSKDARYEIEFKVRFDGNSTGGGLPYVNLTLVNSRGDVCLLFGNAADSQCQVGCILNSNINNTQAHESLTAPSSVLSNKWSTTLGGTVTAGIYTYKIIFETYENSGINDKIYFGVSKEGGPTVSFQHNLDSGHLGAGGHTSQVFTDLGFSLGGAQYVGSVNSVTSETKDGQGGVTMYNYDTTFKSWTRTAETIPEPSAFGLLAGMGALALVASRRRRK